MHVIHNEHTQVHKCVCAYAHRYAYTHIYKYAVIKQLICIRP